MKFSKKINKKHGDAIFCTPRYFKHTKKTPVINQSINTRLLLLIRGELQSVFIRPMNLLPHLPVTL